MPNWKRIVVSGSDATLNTLTVSNGITGSLFGTASYATQALSASYAPGGGSGTVNSGVAGYVAYYPSTDTAVDDTNGLYWDQTNSRLGIGTASPARKLTVVGDIGIFNDGSDSIVSNLYIGNAANTRAFNFQPNAAGTNLALWSYNSSNNWQNLVNFNYDGNVGIGTTTPGAKLDVNGNAVITGSLLVKGTSLVAGYNPIPLAGTIQDGVTSVLGDLNSWQNLFYQGTVLYSETAAGTIGFGQLCYRTNAETWALADATTANAAAAYNMLGICVKASTSTNPTSILINGFVIGGYATVTNSGEPLYMATTAGSVTNTAPTTVGNAVRIIGHTFWDSNTNGRVVIRFNPESSWIEL